MASTTNLVAGGLGILEPLPREVRDIIYEMALHRNGSRRTTRFNTAILTVCRTMYAEAVDLLYRMHVCVQIDHKTAGECPPSSALSRMHHLTVEFSYFTQNRGDCEVSVNGWSKLQSIAEYIALSLRRSQPLQSLTIRLYNQVQRKRGPHLIRSERVRQTFRTILRLFAALPKPVSIMIDGYEVLEYSAMFHEMRQSMAGTDMPVEELCGLEESGG